MALSHSPQIITKDLELYLDSSNIKSYNPQQNLFNSYSEDFSAYWGTYSRMTIVSNSTTAPNGKITASTLTSTAQTSLHDVDALINITPGETYTGSIYFKAGTSSKVYIRMTDTTTGGPTAIFDLKTISYSIDISSQGTMSNHNAKITNAGNGWFRCSLTSKVNAAASQYVGIGFGVANSSGASNYLGGTESCYIWGAQAEKSKYVGDYISSLYPITSSWKDLSKNKKDASFVSLATYSNDSKGILSFDGSSNYATAPDLGTLSNFTMEAWVNFSTITNSNYPAIITQVYPGTTSNLNFSLGYNTSTAYISGGFFNGSWRVAGAFYPTAGKWYNLATTYDGSTIKFYVNGVLNDSVSYSGTITSSGGLTRIGRRWDNPDYINAKISVIKLYSRALSSSEVLQNYNAIIPRYNVIPTSVISNGLIAYLDAANLSSYPGSGTTWTDLSGNGNNATLSSVTYNSSTQSLVFSGYSSNMLLDLNLTSTNYTVIYLSKQTTGSNLRVLQGKGNNWLLGYWNGYTSEYYAEGWVSYNTSEHDNRSSNVYVGTGNISGDKYSIWKNTTKIVTDNSGGAQGPNGLAINSASPQAGNEWSNCEVSAILVYNRVLADDEIIQNVNYLRTRWGL